MSEPILGIDLGTTNSEVAIIQDGKPRVIEEDGDPILPSFVGLSEDGKLLVGKAARNQWVVAPERTIRSIKRKMGQDVKVTLGDQEYRPQEISAMILRGLKDRAAALLGTTVKKAVITVPAYFNDDQRNATREAGELAGLEVVRILNEPTAASLTYDPKNTELHRILVYDLGGGTFDVSIVQAQEGVIEVLSSHGDTQLGGDDFDELLFKHVVLKFQSEHGIDLSANVVSRARVLRAVENAKKELSYHPFVRLEEEFIAEKDGQALHLQMEIDRNDYEELIRPLLNRTMDCVQRALEDAKLAPSSLDKVVLVGGSTRTPLVSRLLEERLGQPAHQEVNPDLCVAMGAAIQAALIAGDDVGAVLVDITPHTLGIRCLDYMHGIDFPFRFAPIVRRNTPLPTSRSEMFATVADSQKEVEIEVYQGEHDDVRFNHKLGNFRITGLAQVPAGNQLTVQCDLNLDGILKVTAREKATGLQKNVTIENALSRFEGAEITEARDRLDRLWEQSASPDAADLEEEGEEYENDFAEDDDGMPELVPAPREGQRETVQARALLEKAERLLEKVPPEDKVELERMLKAVRNAVTDRQWDVVTKACNELSDVLFYLEDA
ncbi:MAG: Hsp70 family protein [Planctomycetes bacterium]|nr:Hsp70 family protein [Planctomycetota bacterium]